MASEGCDCTELCSMGPTCPGGGLAGLPGAGCWRTAPSDASLETVIDRVLAEHRSTGRLVFGSGRNVCSCGAEYDFPDADHVRDALLTALGAWEREARAGAWDEGYIIATADIAIGRPTPNPYRAAGMRGEES